MTNKNYVLHFTYLTFTVVMGEYHVVLSTNDKSLDINMKAILTPAASFLAYVLLIFMCFQSKIVATKLEKLTFPK